jgi:hypothetical protein
MHKTSNPNAPVTGFRVSMQRIRPLTVDDASALKKMLGKGKYNVTAVYTDGQTEKIINIWNVGSTRIPDEYLLPICKKCDLDFTPTMDGQIWCVECNRRFAVQAMGEWPL